MPSAIGPGAWLTMSSRKRLAWRALRAISEIPLLWLSSSSSVMIGRNTLCSSNRNRLVGSCIRTLVSRTNSLVRDFCGFARPGGADFLAAAGPATGRRSVGFNKVEHLLSVAGNLHAAPFAPYHAIAVEDESAALDATHLLTIHVLHLDDAELIAHLLAFVGEQLERESHLGLEILVRPEAVARDAVHRGSGFYEPGMQVAKLRPLHRAAGRVVLRIEVENHPPGFDRREPEFLSAGGGQRKISYCFIGHPVSASVAAAIVARFGGAGASGAFSTAYAKNFMSSPSNSSGASSGR